MNMNAKITASLGLTLGCLLGVATGVLAQETNPPSGYSDRLLAVSSDDKLIQGIRDLTQQLQDEPTNTKAIFNLALAYRTEGDLEKSLALWDDYIRLNPTNDMAFKWRGVIENSLGKYPAAIKDFDAGLRLKPQDASALAYRGFAYSQQGEYEKAAHDFNEAIRVDAKNEDACNNLAWLRATCPVETLRNGAEAVTLATKACDLSHWSRWARIDTLAAAYAEAGDFTKAVEYEKKVLTMDGISPGDLTELRQHLALFENHQPYRDKPSR